MDIKRVTAAILKAVQSWVEPAVQDLSARMEAMNARIDNLPKADPAEISAIVREQVVAALATLPQGEKVEPAQVRAWLDELVAVRVSAIPAPLPGEPGAPGRDSDMDQVRQIIAEAVVGLSAVDAASMTQTIRAEVAARVAEIPVPKNGEPGPAGKDAEPVHPDTLRLMIMQCVREAVAELPKPQDGKGVDMETLQAIIDAKVVTAMAAVPKPKDGEPGRDVDMSHVEMRLAAATNANAIEMQGLLDELANGLGVDLGSMPTLTQQSSPVHVTVNVPIEDLNIAQVQAHVPGMQSMSDAVMKLDATMKRPMRPIFNAQGELIGSERVEAD